MGTARTKSQQALDEDARTFAKYASKRYSTGKFTASQTGAYGRALRRKDSGGMAGYGMASGRTPAEKAVGVGGAEEPSLQRAVTHSALTGKKGSVGAGFQAPTQDETEEMITPGSTKKRKDKRAQIAAARAGY